MALPKVPRKLVGTRAVVLEAYNERHDALTDSTNYEATADDQMTRRKSGLSRTISSVRNSWGIEILAWIVAAASMVGVVITLMIYDNKTLSHWHSTISLNTLVSVLSQIAQIALMVPITACLGQLKWLWFLTTPRPISDFEVFDLASRGLFGSLLLVARTHARHLASLGATLVIVILAFQPFVQQTISFPQRLTVGGNGNAFISYFGNLTQYNYLVSPPGQDNATSDFRVPLSFWAGIYNALSTPSVSLSDIAASCPSGNCTFDSYQSMGVCARPIANLTALITSTPLSQGANCSNWEAWQKWYDGSLFDHQPSCRYSLPNGTLSLDGGGLSMVLNATSATSIVTTDSFVPTIESIAYPAYYFENVIDFFVIYYSNNTHRLEAMECALQVCGQAYNTVVNSSQTTTVLTNTWDKIQYYDNDLFASLNGGPTNFQYKLDYGVIQQFLATSSEIFYGLSQPSENAFTYFLTSEDRRVSPGAQGIGSALLGSVNETASMEAFLDNMAIAITNSFRTSPHSSQFPGTLLTLETYVSVKYQWLTLPIIHILLTLLFLIATIFKNRQQGVQVWKSSALPVLMGFGRSARDKFGDMDSVGRMEAKARRFEVLMSKGDEGWSMDFEGSGLRSEELRELRSNHN